MNTVAFQPMPVAASPFVGASWRPAPPMPAYHRAELARPTNKMLGQAVSVAEGADLLFSLITGIGAMTVGIAAMTVGIGGGARPASAIPGAPAPAGGAPSKAWKWIGGITATLGAISILINVGRISKVSSDSTVQVTR